MNDYEISSEPATYRVTVKFPTPGDPRQRLPLAPESPLRDTWVARIVQTGGGQMILDIHAARLPDALEAIRQTLCPHEYLDTDREDMWGRRYTVCEDCGAEIEEEDTRDFYRDPDTGKVTW